MRTTPLSLPDVRWQLKADLDDDIDDASLQRLVDAAQAHVERVTGLLLWSRPVTQAFSGAGPLLLDAWPIGADPHLTVTYLDPTGSEQQFGGARLAAWSRPARVVLPAGSALPALMRAPDAIRVTVQAGYASASDVPPDVRQAMLMLIAHFDRNREAVVATGAATALELPLGVKAMLGPYMPMVA